MGTRPEYIKLKTTAEPKDSRFDSPKDAGSNLVDEIYSQNIINFYLSIMKTWKMLLNNHCSNISMETIFINTENSKTNDQHKFALNLSQRLLDLGSSNKLAAPQNLSVYYTCGKI